jgi:hypothetical protein
VRVVLLVTRVSMRVCGFCFALGLLALVAATGFAVSGVTRGFPLIVSSAEHAGGYGDYMLQVGLLTVGFGILGSILWLASTAWEIRSPPEDESELPDAEGWSHAAARHEAVASGSQRPQVVNPHVESPYLECPECGALFADTSTYSQHMLRHHTF